MNPAYIFKFFLCVGLIRAGICHAAAFQNLDFEHPTTVPNDPGTLDRIPIDQLMPGWTAYFGDVTFDTVNFNKRALSVVDIALFSEPDSILGWPIIEGTYSVLLRSGLDFFGERVSASTAQSGWVELDILSVRMKIQSNAPFSVRMNGQLVDMVVLEQQPNYTLIAGDVSGFAGQEAELRITSEVYFSPTIGGYGSLFVDDIEFSTVPVPEPATWAVLGLGGLLACGLVRRRR